MWASSRNKTKGSLKRGSHPKRRWSRPRGPKLLSKTRQQIDSRQAVPARSLGRINKIKLRNPVRLSFLSNSMLPYLRQRNSDEITEAATRLEFPNLIIPNTASSASHATPPQSKPGINSIHNAQEQRATVSGLSKSAAVAKVAAKKAAPKSAAGKKRARGDEDEDEDDRHTLPTKKLRVTKAPKAPNPKKIINYALTRKLDVFVCGEGSSGELGLGNSRTAIDVKCPRLNQNLSASEVGVVHISVGGMHAAALTHDGLIYTWGVKD